MNNYKNLISFTIVIYLLSLFILFNRAHAAQDSSQKKCYSHPAMSEVMATVDDILSDLERNKKDIKANPKTVYKIIDRLLVPKADFEIMSQLVLTRNWKKLNTRQKKDFIKEFSRLMIRTYGVAFESYDGETVTYECPVRNLRATGDHKRAEIATTIHSMNRPDNVVKFRILESDKGCVDWQGNDSKCASLTDAKAQACKQEIKQCQSNCLNCDSCSRNNSLEKKVNNCKKLIEECKSIKSDYVKAKDSDNKQQLAKLDSDYESCKDKYNSCKDEVESCQNNCGSCGDCKQSEQVVCSNRNTEWLVYDLIIDNVSIINSYRQIFQDKFKKQKDPDKIIADMHEKNCKDKMFCV